MTLKLFKLPAVLLVITCGALLIGAGVLVAMTIFPTPVTELRPVPGAEMPSNPAIEQRWGIRIKQIGVSADGGLVDFRFIVLDADKAASMLQDAKNLPVLITNGTRRVVNSASLMSAKHDMNLGQTYFLLYRNTGGAIKHNSLVDVVFQDLTLPNAVVF